jgi:hypothetical protein
VGLHHLGQIQHAPQLRGGMRNAHRHDGFAGLGRGQQVRDRADAADARHQAGHLVERPALGELLKAAHLGDVKVRVLDLALAVELDGDLAVAFEAGYGIDGDGLGHRKLRFLQQARARTPKKPVWRAQAPKRVRAEISSGAPVTSAVSAVWKGIGRGRAAGQEDVDLHELVDGTDHRSSLGTTTQGICCCASAFSM